MDVEWQGWRGSGSPHCSRWGLTSSTLQEALTASSASSTSSSFVAPVAPRLQQGVLTVGAVLILPLATLLHSASASVSPLSP